MSKNSGAIYVMLAALLWSLAGLGLKYVPWNPLAISCVRGTVAAITIGCIRRRWRINFTFATVMAALCMFATTVLFMYANKMTTAANAIVLQYTAPIYVLLATVVVTKSKPKAIDVTTIILALLGIMLFFVDHLGHGMLAGDSLALLSGVTFAGVFFFNSLPSANPQDASFLGCALSVILLPALLLDKQVYTMGIRPWIVVILLGVVQLGLAYYCFSNGIKRIGAITASIISAAEPILNPIWVFLVVGERPGVLAIIGGIIVILVICSYNVVSMRPKQDQIALEE